MSITQAIQSALSGLQANQMQAAIVSRNIANAQTDGYVRKNVELGSKVVGGVGTGVEVQSISRKVDEYLIRDMRTSAARVGYQQALSNALTIYTDIVGQPQDERSLATMLGNLERQLKQLGDAPEDAALQQSAVTAAQNLVDTLHRTNDGIRQVREDADAQIAATVTNINSRLVQIHELNRQISAQGTGADNGDLIDQRDRLLDQLSSDLPIRVIQTGASVTVMTQNGVTLLDSEVHALSFSPSPVIPANAAYMPPPAATALSGLTVDGVDISPSSGYPGAIREGSISGLFELRDSIMPRFQKQIDELAAQLAAGFQAADTTVTGAPPNDTGFFTDAGGAVDPASYMAGLAGRITVNALVRPDAGGDPSRLRDGLHAAVSGASGDATQILAFQKIFTTTLSFDAAAGLQTSAKLADFAASSAIDAHSIRKVAENGLTAQKLVYDSLSTSRQSQDGVNVDDEMQKMLMIERSYAASAQVIAAANKMLDQILESLR